MNQKFAINFWDDEKNRKVWDDIVPGAPRKTVPYTLTKDAIQKYCRAVGDTHPLYMDEAYAKASSYGGLIAPPTIHILLMFACTPLDDWMRSPGTINAGQQWSYNMPARPGDRIRMDGRALDKWIRKDRLFVIHDNVFFNQNNEVICSGRGQTIRPM
jgi:acyl dehydratase